jgi:hypothetical protein
MFIVKLIHHGMLAPIGYSQTCQNVRIKPKPTMERIPKFRHRLISVTAHFNRCATASSGADDRGGARV